jgi:23S rRNA (guanosine2251-2'-O)-methyltransferase
VGIFEPRTGVDLEEVLLHLDQVREPALVLVIDSLQDPQNFGVLLRSAEGAGVHGVVVPRHRQVGTTAAVAKTSAGASEHLLIADVANLRQAIDEIKAKGIWVVGSADDGELYYDEVDYRGPTALVVGGEGEGIRRLVREGCDQVVRVPMRGRIASLNAAAAGTVLLFEAQRQRIRDVGPAPRRAIEPATERGEESDSEAPPAEGAGLDPEIETSSDESLAAPPEELEG